MCMYVASSKIKFEKKKKKKLDEKKILYKLLLYASVNRKNDKNPTKKQERDS